MAAPTLAASRSAPLLAPDLPARVARGLVIALPAVTMYGRGAADAMICAIDLLFLWHCAAGGGWAWLRRPWVGLAALLWLWMLATTIGTEPGKEVAQAVVAVRLFLFTAACEAWVLREARTSRWMALVFAGCAAWIALECWQQLLFGSNVFGVLRGGNGVITGPFAKPHAGMTFEAVFFPAVLPFVIGRMQPGRALGERLPALAVLVVAVASVIVTGQRMPLLLTLFGLVIAAAVLPRLRRPVATVAVLVALGLALLPVLSPATFGRLVLLFDQQMSHFWTSQYGQIYVRALGMIQAHPWTGLGFNGFRDHCHDPQFVHGLSWLGVSDAQVDNNGGCNIHPHSTVLELATSFGLPGVVLFYAIAALWLANSLRGWRPAAQPLRSAVVIALLVWVWPISARSSVFIVDAGGWFFLTAGWALALARTDPETDTKTDAKIGTATGAGTA